MTNDLCGFPGVEEGLSGHIEHSKPIFKGLIVMKQPIFVFKRDHIDGWTGKPLFCKGGF